MTFKERAYECQGCGHRTRAFRWDTDPVPPCERCEAVVVETGGTVTQAPAVVDDTIIGGRICETMGDDFFYTSKSQLRAEAERRGYTNVVRHTEEYHAKHRKQHLEELRDTKQIRA